jgi:ATP-dependent Clp protease ATP-binding subunit ClpA
MSGLLDQLLAQTQQIATSLRLSYPTAESILLCLLDNKQYGEDQNLRASGIDVRRLHGALEQNH